MIISVKKLIEGCIAFVALHALRSVAPFTISDITGSGAAVRCCDVICGVVCTFSLPLGDMRRVGACQRARMRAGSPGKSDPWCRTVLFVKE